MNIIFKKLKSDKNVHSRLPVHLSYVYVIAQSIPFPVGPDKYSRYEFQVKTISGKFNCQITICALHLRITLLGNSLWIILAIYLNYLHGPFTTHVCISYAVKHTYKHIPICILAVAWNFKELHVHLFISHSIDNLYPCRRGHREKNQW